MSDGRGSEDFGEGAITILTHLKVEPGKLDRFDQLFALYAADVRTSEPGCLHYDVVRAAGARESVLIIAKYASLDAYKDHVEASHTVSILKILDDLLDAHPELEIYVD
jgi:quinol monooxygenase YgiN